MPRLYQKVRTLLMKATGVEIFRNETKAEFAILQRRLDDILLAQCGGTIFPDPHITLKTDFPVANYSDDHKHPRGTANDNTRHPRFVRASEAALGKNISFLDIGCSGGGLVFDFLQHGHEAIGLEGSDYSFRQRRGCWPLIPHHLHTCNAVEPFELLRDSGATAKFNLISAWEVLEHIPESMIPGLLANIHKHLAPGGIFVGSVAMFPDADPDTGAVWHVTLKSKDWWHAQFRKTGLEVIESPYGVLDYPRGSGNPSVNGDWNAADNPEAGFHIAVRLA